MASFEQTIIIGNVGRDPEMRYTQGNAAVCSFSVAVSTKWTDRATGEKRERTTWYSVSCWNKLAETAHQYVRKGTPIMVIGTVTARGYMGNDGQVKASLELRADNFRLLGGRDDGANQVSGGAGYDDEAPTNPTSMDDIPF
ncbi:MAG: single-stranded DNA-binding protein [Anaerolineae bacterium]|nr:single-stranded DNA-binding protein [Anaerolineae bacterium]MDW8171260.1 single-stranded DNA-binding protein [Anaerolineae bacterium]